MIFAAAVFLAETKTDNNGYFLLTTGVKNEELEEGYFTIQVKVDSTKYLTSQNSLIWNVFFSYHIISSSTFFILLKKG